MVIIILASVLMVAIIFYQAMQGAFSAMIMAMLSVLCAAVALNYFEPLGLLLMGRLGGCAQAVSLLALFVLPLLGLRILSDRFIKGNVVLTAWSDRLGGAALGLITAMTLVGILVIVLYLLPLPAAVFTYRPYDTTLAAKDGGPPQWAAEFTLGLAKHLSAGPMRPIGGGRSFAEAHNDLTLETFCLRNRPPGARAWAPDNSMRITDAYHITHPPKARTPATYTPEEADRARILQTPKYARISGDTTVLVVRVRVDQLARSKTDNWYRLPATHFRLITDSGKDFYPVDYLTHAGVWRLNAQRDEKGYSKIGDLVVARPWAKDGGPAELVVDWVYRLPPAEKPRAVIFRRACWADMPVIIDSLPQVFDEDRSKLALSIRPSKSSIVEFPAGGAASGRRPRLLEPEKVEARSALPESMGSMRLNNDQSLWPPSLRGINCSSKNQLAGADISVAEDDLRKAPKSGSRYVKGFQPASGKMIVQFKCRVNDQFQVDAATRSKLTQMIPRLLLDDGHQVAHYGAYLMYTPRQDRWVRLYYDSRRPAGRIKRDFATKLLDNAKNVERVGFIFVVPINPRRSVVGMSLGIGPDYEFHAPRPVATGQSR